MNESRKFVLINKLQQFANHYAALGLRVNNISNKLTLNNSLDTNILKAPQVEFHEEDINHQLNRIQKIPWAEATGVGIFLGINNLIAIDIDGTTNLKLVERACEILQIPKDYKWIIKSGSLCGYHIVIYCSNISPIAIENYLDGSNKLMSGFENSPLFGEPDTNAYFPHDFFRSFQKIEFKWKGNLVLPPSIHPTGSEYEFINGIPEMSPLNVDFSKLIHLRKEFASLQAYSSTTNFSWQDKPDTFIAQFVAKADEDYNSFQSRRLEQKIIFSVCKYKIKDREELNLKNRYLKILIQLSWYILDKNFNVIKRQTFNYIKNNNDGKNITNFITRCKAESIITHPRIAYHEFLFDLDHVTEIISFEENDISFIKNEIIQNGLFLDNFKMVKLQINQPQYLDNIKDKNLVFLKSDDNFISITEQYCQEFNQELLHEVNSNFLLYLLYKFLLKQNELDENLPKKLILEIEDELKVEIDENVVNDNYSEDDCRGNDLRYVEYGGAYGYDDESINTAFEGDPENYWNVD